MTLPSKTNPNSQEKIIEGVDPDIIVSVMDVVEQPPIEASVPAEAVDATHEQHVVNEYVDRYATLAVRLERTGKILCATDQFLLVGMNEVDQERFSMTYTLGDPVIRAGMGRRPRMFSYTGILVDTEKDGSAISVWKVLYDRYLRGHACVKNGAIIELRFRDQLRRGYVTSCNMTYAASNPLASSFSFTMFVIEARSVDGGARIS